MAKKPIENTERTEVTTARSKLKEAEKKYHDLAHDHGADIKDQRKALAEKRLARIELECTLTGKPMPPIEDMPETKAIAKKEPEKD